MRPKPEILLSEDQKRIVWDLRISGPSARTALADRLDMHNGAVTRLSRELIALGLVEEHLQDQRGGRGRPIVPLGISSRGGYAAGATVHPGWLEIALVDFTGTVIVRDLEPFDSPDPRAFVEAVDRRLRGLSMSHKMLRSRFLGLGVAATGPTLAGDPTRRWAVDWLQGWRDLDLQRLFADYLGLPVWIENDGTLAALAEYYDSGLIRTCSSAIVFFIGHGVGGGIIVDRAILRGEHGNAGEIGRLFPGGSARPSGIDLLAELQAAGAAIHALNEVEIHQDTHAALIASWVERAGRQLAVAADSGVAWLDPGAIVVSGALPLPILRALGEALERAEWATAFPHLPRPTVYVSRLGSWAAAVGAALLPIHQLAAPNIAR